MSSTYTYSGDPSLSDTDAVRSEIRDVNSNAWLLSNEEIDFYILDENQVAATSPTALTAQTLYSPAARCCEVIAQAFLQQADTQIGQLKITSTKRADQYLARALTLRDKAQSYAPPYAGGQSQSEKENFNSDADAVPPAFTRTEWDSPYVGSQDGFSNNQFGPPVG